MFLYNSKHFRQKIKHKYNTAPAKTFTQWLLLLLMSLLLADVRFTFLEGNTYYIWQQASPLSWQKPEKLGFEHPQAQQVLS